jgi:hypothetical protein
MNNLSQECIKQIEKYAESYYPLELGYDNVITTLESTVNTERRNCVINGAMQSLLDPTIYQSAGLMSVEEALMFAEWVDDSQYIFNSDINKWQPFAAYYDDSKLTTTDLLTIFRNQPTEIENL